MASPVPLLLLLAAAGPTQASGPTDERLREAWSYLLPAEQHEVAAWFAAEVAELDTFQNGLLRHVLSLEPRDPGTFPEDRPPPVYDPEVHAPRQPIPRRPLAAEDRRARAVRERFLGPGSGGSRPSAWRYDWARGEVVRTADFQAPEHLFESGLAGFAPRVDFAEAIVEGLLDGGGERAALAAFGHAYADREGNVYPGVTLYDAWASGTEIEMPDVEVLGIVHDLIGEQRRWRAPVPASRHDELYGAVGELFLPAQRYRGLREALARTYFAGSPPLREPYALQVVRLHGLWEAHASRPADLRPALPDGKRWSDFLAEWTLRIEEDADLVAAARARQATLERDAERVRTVLASVMERFGALERSSRPAPEPPEPPPEEPRRRGKGGR